MKSQIVKVPCGKSTCSPSGGSGGKAACISKCTPYSSWCVGAFYKAVCNASGAIQYSDCVSNGGKCQQGSSGASCVKATTSNRKIYGTIQFPSRYPTSSGYSALAWYNARKVIVGVLKAGGTTWEVLSYTDNNGYYSITLPSTVPNSFYLAVMPWRTDFDGSVLQVLDTKKALYQPYIAHTMTGSVEKLDLQINEPVGSAFSVFDNTWASLTQATSKSGGANKSLNVYWEKGKDFSCGSCFWCVDPKNPLNHTQGYSVDRNSIMLSGGASKQSHYDQSVIAHEVGHYAVYLFSKDDSTGGPHSLPSTIYPAFAWSEGLATGYGQLWIGNPKMMDGNSNGMFWVDLEKAHSEVYSNGKLYGKVPFIWPSYSKGMIQGLDECVVASMIWSTGKKNTYINGSLNLCFAKIWDVATKYMTKQDRVNSGADLVDFLDGLVCRKHATPLQVYTMYVGTYKFPYDFGGPNTCP